MAEKGKFFGLADNLDEPIPTGAFDLFKKNKMRCIIVYEDGSYKDFFQKFNGTYTIKIKGRAYFVKPNCIMRGKYPTIVWFFNNPMPIDFSYQQSEVTAEKLVEEAKLDKMTDEEREILANIKVDSDGLQSMFNSKLLQGLYADGGMSVKSMIIILIVVLIVILVILQVTGTIDLQSIISG